MALKKEAAVKLLNKGLHSVAVKTPIRVQGQIKHQDS